MADAEDSPMAEIHALAAAALRSEGCPADVARALERIVALAEPPHGDTPEASDPPRTENQSL